jgi:hypothetical protein
MNSFCYRLQSPVNKGYHLCITPFFTSIRKVSKKEAQMLKYKKQFPLALILLISLFSGVEANRSLSQFNSVRIVLFYSLVLSDSLLDRIKKNDYNYAAVSFPFRNSNETVGDGDVYANLRADVCSLCIALNSRGIRFIPVISMSSRWALQWKTVQRYENPAIGMNTITSNDDIPVLIGKNTICQYADNHESVTLGSNSWANEPEGFDKSIIDVFTAIRDGFADAKLPYSLEYVHIEHDEPQFLNWLLMGGVGAQCGNALPYRGNFARGAVSSADVAYIAAQLHEGHTPQEAYQRLLADELYRRVVQADQVFGQSVKLLFYAESFDDQSWGGVPWRVSSGDSLTIVMNGVIDLPGLTEERKYKVKERTVPVLWNYDGKIAFVNDILGWLNRGDYNSDSAFKRFAARGYDFLYVGALENGTDSKNQIKEYAAAAKEYRGNCLGYLAAAWNVIYDNGSPDPKWDVIEYLHSVQGATAADCPPRSHPPILFSLPPHGFSSSGLAVTFSLLQPQRVEIDIYTIAGRHVAKRLDRIFGAGTYSFSWKQRPGLYLIRFRAGQRATIIQGLSLMK